MTTERRVTFHSDGAALAGILRLPEGASPDAPCPAVVFCAGMSLTKEVWLPAQAEALAAAGFVTLNFDYTFFGESEGQPRRRLVPQRQVRDVMNALTFLESLPEVDASRLGVSGTSLGAPVAVSAAVDPRVRAGVAIAGPMDLGRVWSAFDGFAAFKAKVSAARQRYVSTGEVSYVSVARLLKSDPETVALLERDVERFEHWSLEITFESLLDLFAFDAEATLDRVKGALMFMTPAQDDLIAGSEALSGYAKAPEPKAFVKLPGTHADVYRSEGDSYQRVQSEQLAWFQRHLGAAS